MMVRSLKVYRRSFAFLQSPRPPQEAPGHRLPQEPQQQEAPRRCDSRVRGYWFMRKS